MSRQTSIFQFFGKSDQSKNQQQSSNQSSLKKSNNSSKENFKPAKPKFALYDIVWALLDGYPYWPAIICNHPTTKLFYKTEKGKEFLHVQFFDRPPTRNWVKADNCIFLENEKHPKLAVVNDVKLKAAIEWATGALEVDKQERSRLIVDFKESDNEASDLELMNSDSDELSPLNKSTRINKRKFELESDDDETSTQSTFKKSKTSKIFILDSDSEDEFKPDKNDCSMTSESVMSDELMSDEFSEDEFVEEDESNDIAITPIKKKSSSSRTKKSTKSTKKDNAAKGGNNATGGDRKWQHLKLDFLQPENIRDKNGKRPDDPNYDPKTLYIPDSYYKKQTSTQRQWWDIKRDHFDTILFFKMGKFYELFHFDAVIVAEITNIIYMKGDWAHCGFPEKAYAKFADKLIELGYKVARVEQTETADARDKRAKEQKGEKVVRREVCRITSKGTRSFNEIASVADDPYSSFILAITEKVLDNNQVLTGLCFIDTSIGEFHIGQLIDDKYSSLLRTVFTHYPPVEILLEKDNITSQTLQTIKSCLPNTLINYLKTDTEFWSPRETLKFLIEGPYFKVLLSETDKEELIIPNKLKDLLDPSDVLNLTVKKEYELAIKAFGAIVYQLKRNLIEEELLALKRFNIFDTNFLLATNKSENKDFMVLDSVTIKNLELFENSIGGKECTLLNTIDTCMTKFGKRRLRKWLCSPLNVKKDIDDRLSAVTELMKLSLNDLRNELKILPDLERILLKIHTQSLSNRSKNHPDSRAVFMEALSMNKSKIGEFCKLLDSFRHCDRFVKELRNQLSSEDTESEFLLRLINYKENNGMFPNSIEVLKFFDNAFDHKTAKEKGIIIPRRGVNKDYEKAEENIKRIENGLENHLKNLRREYGSSKLEFIGKGKNRYQIEFPDKILVKKDFEKTSQRKGFNRYQDKITKDFLSELKIYEAHKEEAMQDCWRMILQAFMEHKDDWSTIIKIIAILDCLISLAHYANTLKTSGTICKPTILDQENQIIRFKDGKHPSLTNIEFIPNSLDLDSKLMLLSGSNMSGKSTLMRQTGLMVLLAHIGSYLPASEFQCTIVDRIFTRLGATDRILEGESTFYVELSETSTIIKHATSKSLVLLDELGRGTSSVDGTAIAGSVVDYLSTKICCPTMFSTHYSTLMEEFKLAENVRFGHMACCVENEDLKDVTNESITFLYKLVEGISPKSHGFNAAKLSGIPDHVIQTGYNKAQELNKKIESFKLLTKLIKNENMSIKQMRLLLDYIVD